MKIIKPPAPFNEVMKYQLSIFLAGSIEMGTAEDWQTRVENRLLEAGIDALILNPRRDDWDSTWAQEMDNGLQFTAQVEWELKAMESVDVIAMYFSPETKAPITLLELGLFAHTGKIRLCCPDGFWRKGNVDIVCRRYGIQQFKTLDNLIVRLVRESMDIA